MRNTTSFAPGDAFKRVYLQFLLFLCRFWRMACKPPEIAIEMPPLGRGIWRHSVRRRRRWNRRLKKVGVPPSPPFPNHPNPKPSSTPLDKGGISLILTRSCSNFTLDLYRFVPPTHP